jgi:hypothetical protein
LVDWLLTGLKLALRHFPALVVISLVADLPLSLIRAWADGVDNGVTSFLAGMPAIAVITPLATAAAIVAIDRWERGETGALHLRFETVQILIVRLSALTPSIIDCRCFSANY